MQIRRQTLIAFLVVSLGIASAWLSTSPLLARQTTLDSKVYSGLHWRLLGPFRGGRVDAVSGVPGCGRTSSTSARSTAASGKRLTRAACGSRCSTASQSPRLARSPSRRRSGHDRRRQRRVNASRLTGYGNGVYKSTVILVMIEDDGRGFDQTSSGDGRLGLLGMRERVELLDGSLQIDAEPGHGTTLIVALPMQ